MTKSVRIEGFEDPCIFGHGNEQNPLDNSSLYYVTRDSMPFKRGRWCILFLVKKLNIGAFSDNPKANSLELCVMIYKHHNALLVNLADGTF